MHELGVVFATIDLLEDTARERDLTHIRKVTLELGEVSGIVTDFFQDAWEWAASKNELVCGAQLEIQTVPAVTVCNACGKTYGTVDHGRVCPFCQSADTELLRGNEMNILSIEAE